MHDTKYHERVAVSPYQATRSVFQRIFMRKGRYVILPTTTKPNLTGGFLLRMYISGSANVRYASFDKLVGKTIFCKLNIISLTKRPNTLLLLPSSVYLDH